MATAPVKSQPLHNFSLPFLKWGGKSHTNSTTRCRRTVSPASSEPDSDYHLDSDPPSRVGSRSARNRFGFSPCSFNNNNNKQAAEHSGADDVADVEAAAEAEEGVQKPWKLRPRKAVQRSAMVEIESTTTVTTVLAIPAPQAQNENPKSMRLRGGQSQSTETKKKKEKNKFWIALSKEEIEEDVFIMTGSRPARRPRKRPKNVQKQLDSVFPGLWLVGTTADSYRLAEAPAKRLPYIVGGQRVSRGSFFAEPLFPYKIYYCRHCLLPWFLKSHLPFNWASSRAIEMKASGISRYF